jgi:hypothetical protein
MTYPGDKGNVFYAKAKKHYRAITQATARTAWLKLNARFSRMRSDPGENCMRFFRMHNGSG